MNYKKFKNINIFATHGHAIQEAELGQKFVLEITMFGKDLKDVSDAISDDSVEQIVIDEGINVHRDMIQAVSGNIAEKILAGSTEAVSEVRVEVKKPSTPFRVGIPGGLAKYVSTNVSSRRPGYKSEYLNMEEYNYTKVRSARVFNRDVKYEVDLEVAFPMEDSIREDNIAYSYSYTTIYDVAVETVKNNLKDTPAVLLEKMVDYIYKDNPKAQKVRATIRDYLPENNLSVDYMEYQLIK